MTFEELLAKVKTGELTASEQDLLLKATKSLSSGKVPEEFKSEYKSDPEWFAKLSSGISEAMQTPTGKANIELLQREKSGDRFVRAYKPFFNSLLQGVDIATSLSQIKSANKAIASLVQPGIPQGPGIDPALNNEIAKAQRGTFDTTRALAPVRQANQDAYNAADLTDRQISNGQSGQYGSLKQANYNDLLRANGQLPAIADSIKAREQANLANLIQQRSNFAQNKYANDLQGTQMAMDQYNKNVNAAALLGSTGRSNLRNVFQTLPDNLLRTTGMLAGGQALVPGTPEQAPVANPNGYSSSFMDKYNDYGRQVEQNLANHMVRLKRTSPTPYRNRYAPVSARTAINFNPTINNPY